MLCESMRGLRQVASAGHPRTLLSEAAAANTLEDLERALRTEKGFTAVFTDVAPSVDLHRILYQWEGQFVLNGPFPDREATARFTNAEAAKEVEPFAWLLKACWCPSMLAEPHAAKVPDQVLYRLAHPHKKMCLEIGSVIHALVTSAASAFEGSVQGRRRWTCLVAACAASTGSIGQRAGTQPQPPARGGPSSPPSLPAPLGLPRVM